MAQEKERQSKHASMLLDMYSKICTNELLEILITISSYSANSIRRNTGRLLPIEVLFAPEKNRPKAELFKSLGIDFEKEDYILLLNAGRIEKNAVSAVAALDLLFKDANFADQNQTLKFVLIGVDNINQLGMNAPSIANKLIAIHHLPASQLEYVLSKARGLIYSSFNEGFGYPPLEAMSLGIPCVVSENTSIPEVCGDAVYYCDPFCVNSIADGLRRLLASPVQSELLINQAKAIYVRQSKDLIKLINIILGIN
jgi:glycosyltransferase involved in cell wall biosynthesis